MTGRLYRRSPSGESPAFPGKQRLGMGWTPRSLHRNPRLQRRRVATLAGKLHGGVGINMQCEYWYSPVKKTRNGSQHAPRTIASGSTHTERRVATLMAWRAPCKRSEQTIRIRGSNCWWEMWLEPTLVFLHKCQEQTPSRPSYARLRVPVICNRLFLFVPDKWRALFVGKDRPEFDVGKKGVETLPSVKSRQSFRRACQRGRNKYISAPLFTFSNAGSTLATRRNNNHIPSSHFILPRAAMRIIACRSASLSPSSPASEPLELGSSSRFTTHVGATRAGAFPRCGVPMGVCTADWTG